MTLDAAARRLLGRAERSLGDNRVTEAVARVRAIIGPKGIPQDEPVAQRALDKLRAGEVPAPEELVALETVVRLLRPVVYSRNGRLDDLPEAPGHNLLPEPLKQAWSGFRDKVAPVIGAIGRIDLMGRHLGTGFSVADGLIATNRHVLGYLTRGAEAIVPGSARIVFKGEVDLADAAADIVSIDGVAAVHPRLDMVLLRVPARGRPVVAFEDAAPAEGTRVAAIGYPGDDEANNPLFLSSVFQGRFGVRRAALGEVLDEASPLVFHDCSTTRGNSGSPVFSLDTGRVTAIHSAGRFMYRNEAIVAPELAALVAATG